MPAPNDATIAAKNYETNNGDTWVVRGTLSISGKVTGADGTTPVKAHVGGAPSQADFNAVLDALYNAGIMTAT